MKSHKSWKNLEDWKKGKAKLKYATLAHPEEKLDSIYDFIEKKINRRFWMSKDLSKNQSK
jgi:hypothetical protein